MIHSGRITVPIVAVAALSLGGCVESGDPAEEAASTPAPRSCPASIEAAWAEADPEVVATGAAIARAAAVRALEHMDSQQRASDPESANVAANEAAAVAWSELDPCTLAFTPEGLTLLPAPALDALRPGYEPQSTAGAVCRAACWAAGALGCSAVSVTCTGTTVITVGGTSIPCAWAIIAACTGSAAGASLCSDKCQP